MADDPGHRAPAGAEREDHDARFSHESAHEAPAAADATPAPRRSAASGPALQRTGATATAKIAAAPPPRSSDPLKDAHVQDVLHDRVHVEDAFDAPYDAAVTTLQDPLRLRASSSLTAPIVARMPRGARARVTGATVNFFRPVEYEAPGGKGKPVSGWAFTYYLSPHQVPAGVAAPISVLTESITVTAEQEVVEPTHAEIATELAARPIEAPLAVLPGATPAHADAIVAEVQRLNEGGGLGATGLYYKHQYQDLVAAGKAHRWSPAWERGHTDAPQWLNPTDLHDMLTWQLKEGQSASAALKAWLAGLTLADCTTAMVALELDSVRKAIGDDIFDAAFGSVQGPAKVDQLKISYRLDDTPLLRLMRFTDAARNAATMRGAVGQRPVQAGEWYYFANVPDYVYKHPGGAWRGENALCLGVRDGKQLWSGLGVTSDEEGLLRALVEQHNAPRDERDFSWIEGHFAIEAGVSLAAAREVPRAYKEGFAASRRGEQPVPNDGARDQVKLADVLATQSVVPAKGSPPPAGIDLSSGMALSTAKLAELVRTVAGPPKARRPEDDGPRNA